MPDDTAHPDQLLMQDLADGSHEALTHLMNTHQAALLSFFRRLGSGGDVDDLTQETFIRLYNCRHRYRPAAPFTTFLYRIARSVWIDRYRKRMRRERMMGFVRLDASIAEQCISATQRSTRHADAEEALARLPQRLREVLVLTIYQGLQQKEVAEILDIPLGTVKSRVYHAINSIREILDEQSDSSASPE